MPETITITDAASATLDTVQTWLDDNYGLSSETEAEVVTRCLNMAAAYIAEIGAGNGVDIEIVERERDGWKLGELASGADSKRLGGGTV